MDRYHLISKEWLVSRTARMVYRAAAIVSLGLIPVLAAMLVTYPIPAILRQILFLCVLATALNLIGMEYFLFRFDDSHAVKQIFWFVLMIFIPIGPALYCLVVYSRSSAFNQVEGARNGAAGETMARESVENRDLR